MEKELKRTELFTINEKFIYVLSQANFVLTLLAITCLFVTVTAVQFWMTDYMVSVLGQSQNNSFKTFSFVAAVGPISGVICGGILFDRCGGYNSYKSLHVLQLAGLGAWTTGVLAASMSNFYAFVVFMFFQLFFGGMVMPAATGIMLNQVPQNMRTVCNSVANMCYNMFGYVPAPYVYGFMYQQFGQGKSHAGLYCIEFFGFMSFVFSLIVFLRKKYAFRQFLKHEQLGATYGVAAMQENNSGSNFEHRESDIEAIDVASNSE